MKKEKPRRSGAFSLHTWRREPESNRPKRLCRPLHNRFAIAPKADCRCRRDGTRQILIRRPPRPSNKKGSVASHVWSGRRVSNSRPQPWQGCALPTELLPRCPACAASCRTTRCRKSWSGRRVSNSRPQPWQGCALPTELLPRIALPLLRHRYFVVQRRSEIMSKAHSCVKGFSRPFSKNFRCPPRATRVTRRCARESAATRASCSTASTRSSGWPPDTSATRPIRACRSSRRRAAAARSTAASESRPSGTRS